MNDVHENMQMWTYETRKEDCLFSFSVNVLNSLLKEVKAVALLLRRIHQSGCDLVLQVMSSQTCSLTSRLRLVAQV